MRLRLQRVHYMPKELEPGWLYASDEFSTAAHLCACGCGAKVRTPLGPTEWSLQESDGWPTLRPSVGNWQQACQSHYLILRGEVVWCDRWTPAEIVAGRSAEEGRRAAYFEALEARRGFWQRQWDRIRKLFR